MLKHNPHVFKGLFPYSHRAAGRTQLSGLPISLKHREILGLTGADLFSTLFFISGMLGTQASLLRFSFPL